MKLQPSQVLVDPRPFFGNKLLHRPNVDIAAGLDETSNRLALRQHTLLYVLHVDGSSDLVQARLEIVVGHVLETVANIDIDLGRMLMLDRNKRIRLVAEAVLDLEATGVILEEERDHAEVSVRPGAAVLAGRQFLRGYWGVVIHAQLIDDGRFLAAAQELVLRKTQAFL